MSIEYVHLSLKALRTTAPSKAASLKGDFKKMLLAFICSSLLQLNTKSEHVWKNVLPTQTFFLIIVSLSTENAAEGVNSCNTGSYKYATYAVAMLE